MTEQTDKEVKKYKRLCIILAIVSIALAILSIYSLTHVREYVVTAEQAVNAQDDLQAELDSILREYEAVKSEYGSLNEQLTAKDSAILAQADEIQKLIASQGDYRRIKKKLELLQDQGKEYVNLLDSVYYQRKQRA